MPNSSQKNTPNSPLVAITSDLMIRKDRPTAYLTMSYAQAVIDAGGIPIILPPSPASSTNIEQLIARFDCFILSGGDDPKTEPFNTKTHPAAIPVLDARQSFETQLINALDHHPNIPVLGICLGMQMLALCKGGALNQHLPDTHESHASHWNHEHEITSTDESVLPSGSVYSSHRQAVSDPGSMRIIATAPDAIIEAIDDPTRKFTLGIQWHPERTENPGLGLGIFDRFIQATS